MTSKSLAPAHHDELLTKQLAIWRDHLRANDAAKRLHALRAIGDYVYALIADEYATPQAKATPAPQMGYALRLLLARLKRYHKKQRTQL